MDDQLQQSAKAINDETPPARRKGRVRWIFVGNHGLRWGWRIVLFIAIFFHQAMTNFSESEWLVVTAPIGFVVTTLAVFSLARLLKEQASRGVRTRQG